MIRDPDTWLGTAWIEPAAPVEAGSFGEWRLTYRVGRYGIDDSGVLQVLIRLVCDWGSPQLDDPAGAGFTTVTTTGRARLRARYEAYAGVRPWSRGLVIQVYEGVLAEGDLITVVWGDRSGGSPGCRAQTYPEAAFEFRIMVDPFGTGVFERLPSSPTLPVVAGPASSLVALAASDAVVDEPAWLLVRAQDRWGNPDPSYRGTIRFALEGPAPDAEAGDGTPDLTASPAPPGLPAAYTCTADDAGVHRFTGPAFAAPGDHRIVVTAADGLATVSNPITCRDTPPDFRLLWGDTQGQSGATVGTGAIEPFFRYARDVAGLDFVVHSGNDFQITGAHWAETREATRRFHAPGRFVTFLSYEWSGNTPAGGDHNILFSGDDGPLHRSSHWQLADRSDEGSDRYPISELWATFRQAGVDAIAIAHVGGRRSDFGFHDPQFCPVIEIASVHGRFEWFAREALAHGLVVGFVGATDDHSGRPGASYPTAGAALPVRGGLAAVYARDLTREALWEALRARRCYATTGERMRLLVRSGRHWLGERFAATAAPPIEVEAHGTAPLEAVEVLRGAETIYRYPLGGAGQRLRLAWSGARAGTRSRHTRWDGGLTLSAGRIRGVDPWGFDSPLDGIVEAGERAVRWRSGTSGDPDGITLDLDAPPGAVLAFRAGPANLSFRPAEVGPADTPLVFDCGGLEQRVTVWHVPAAPGPRQVAFTFRDPAPRPGLNAYWVRVVQADSETAWSSPLYVDLPAH